MLEIGKINSLIVSRETSSGFYLKKDDEFGDVFLPPSLSKKDLQIGDEAKAFIYVDTKDQLVATLSTPVAEVGEFAFIKAIDVQEFGSFFEWGIEKDLLVPGNEQKIKVRPNEYHLVRICLEEGTDRIYGTTKVGKYIEDADFDIEMNQKVDLLPFEETELGYRVIINKKYIGMIYHSEIFKDVRLNYPTEGFVKKVRDDGLIDAALQIQGIKNLDHSKIKILEFLHKKNGRSHLNDKSSPEEINDLLGMSKKTFKNAIGMLYKDKKIIITKEGISLVKKN